jgi:Gas vesicle synthesis protein GvpL/GvpF
MTASSTEAPPTTTAYVYGVVARGALPGLESTGVADAPVRSIDAGDIAAIASLLPTERLRVRRRDLVGHLRVLEEAFAATTVVPCAFGMVLPSEESVRTDFLEPQQEHLRALLRRLDGFAQMNVRVEYDEDVVLREIVESDREIAQLREQTRALGDAGYAQRIRLGELVAAAFEARRERDGAELLERFARRADEVAPEPPEEAVLKASFLVARKHLDAFDAELDAAAREQAPRVQIESIGPMPPSAFVSIAEGRWGS